VSLVESLSDGVLMLNHKKNVQLMNEAFSRFTGLSKDYFGIDNLYKLFPDIEMTDMLEQALEKGKISHINEIKLLNKYFEIFVTPVRDNHDSIVAVAMIFHDITTLKEIDQLKTEFVSVASHQLRTPLTAIKLFTDMLRREEVGKLNEGQKTYIENVHESTERMVRLVNDLLNVTRIESGRLRIEPQPVDVGDLVKSIAGELKPLAENDGKTIELNFKDELKGIPLDQNLIRQVVHNLLANAIRYSAKDKGKVVCTVEKSSKNFFQISVKDNGIGIPKKVQPRIFEKFYRADNAVKSITEGTGLGLYVSRMIVEVSGGKVWFESEENKGSTFFVQLPLAGMPKKEGERGLVIS
jgi:PAS domain S-box-containing protein